jgi:membrane dipeptidase
MDRLAIIHDQSHLSDAATDDLFEATDRVVIASHSNCRAITDPTGVNERHLTDATIREIARRGGVIGLNLFSVFLVPGGRRGVRASVDQALAHVEHVCSLVGHTKAVGLGSDMDGGLSTDALPQGIDEPSGLMLLAEGLAQRGWTDDALRAFMHGNWARVVGERVP